MNCNLNGINKCFKYIFQLKTYDITIIYYYFKKQSIKPRSILQVIEYIASSGFQAVHVN